MLGVPLGTNVGSELGITPGVELGSELLGVYNLSFQLFRSDLDELDSLSLALSPSWQGFGNASSLYLSGYFLQQICIQNYASTLGKD